MAENPFFLVMTAGVAVGVVAVAGVRRGDTPLERRRHRRVLWPLSGSVAVALVGAAILRDAAVLGAHWMIAAAYAVVAVPLGAALVARPRWLLFVTVTVFAALSIWGLPSWREQRMAGDSPPIPTPPAIVQASSAGEPGQVLALLRLELSSAPAADGALDLFVAPTRTLSAMPSETSSTSRGPWAGPLVVPQDQRVQFEFSFRRSPRYLWWLAPGWVVDGLAVRSREGAVVLAGIPPGDRFHALLATAVSPLYHRRRTVLSWPAQGSFFLQPGMFQLSVSPSSR